MVGLFIKLRLVVFGLACGLVLVVSCYSADPSAASPDPLENIDVMNVRIEPVESHFSSANSISEINLLNLSKTEDIELVLSLEDIIPDPRTGLWNYLAPIVGFKVDRSLIPHVVALRDETGNSILNQKLVVPAHKKVTLKFDFAFPPGTPEGSYHAIIRKKMKGLMVADLAYLYYTLGAKKTVLTWSFANGSDLSKVTGDLTKPRKLEVQFENSGNSYANAQLDFLYTTIYTDPTTGQPERMERSYSNGIVNALLPGKPVKISYDLNDHLKAMARNFFQTAGKNNPSARFSGKVPVLVTLREKVPGVSGPGKPLDRKQVSLSVDVASSP